MKFMAVPRHLDIEITSRCNLRCAYCSHFSSEGDVGSDLPKETWFQFFEELETLGLMDITLSGGEPLLRHDIREIIAKIVACRMRFSLLSNGTLITEDLAVFLKSTHRLNSIQISIDGISSDTHDVYRGEGTFEKAVNGIKLLQRTGIIPTVRVTIHDRNVDQLEEIADFLLGTLNLPSFSTNAAFLSGTCRKNEQICLSTKQHSKAMQTLVTLSEKYPGTIHAQAGPLADAHIWGRMAAAARDKLGPFSTGGKLTGCGCVFSKLAVRADGAIVPCNLLGGLVLGHINKDSLKDIWQNHSVLETFRYRQAIPLSDFETCRDCEYRSYCTGNCPALAVSHYNDPHTPSPEGCLRRFLQSGGTLPSAILASGKSA